jgi:hypothetical protein
MGQRDANIQTKRTLCKAVSLAVGDISSQC